MAVVTCIPRAGRYPAIPFSPQWWDTSTPHDPTVDNGYSDRIDDPRWAGCFKKGVGTGAAEQFAFRALYATIAGPTYLYLSFHVKIDPQPSTFPNNGVQIGLHTGTGAPSAATPAYIIKIALTSNTSNASAAGSARYTHSVLINSGGGWTPVTPPPSWVAANTRMWLQGAGLTTATWAIHIRVPILADPNGIPLGATFGLCYYVGVFNTMIGMITHRWPSTNSFVPYSGTPPSPNAAGIISPTAADFQPCSIGAPVAGSSCSSAGITMTEADIGTVGVTAGGVISPQAIRHTAGSTTRFFVQPQNQDPALAITANDIFAEIKLANWGSKPVSDRWQRINHTQFLPPAPPTGNLRLEALWTLTAAEATYYTTNYHQCMLAELSSQNPAVTFIDSAVARNMDFVGASKARELAEISVEGLEPFSKNGRYVYIFIDTKNMPRQMDGQTAGGYKIAAEMLPYFYPFADDDRSSDAAAYTFARFEQYMPTYRCHVYYDTGVRIEADGEIYPVVEAQPSFGYHVWHQGSLIGWDLRLQGALKLAENIYAVKVGNEGSVKVVSVIHAIEEKGEELEPPERIVPREQIMNDR